MNEGTNYRGYFIDAGAELGCLNPRLYKGHYIISTRREGELTIVHEGFLEELLEQDSAYKATNISARAWVDKR